MAVDAVTAIKNDHRLLERLFEELRAGHGDRRALVEEVRARLNAHARAEEREVYPGITKADPGEAAEVEHAYHEHHEAEHLLKKVRNLVDSPHFDDALADFVAAVAHHVEEEESKVLPAFEKAVDEATLRRLGAAFERARAEELGRAGFDPDAEPGGAADSSGTGGPAGDPDGELESATRDELYEMAKEAEVPGRSTMNKGDLIDALREQEPAG